MTFYVLKDAGRFYSEFDSEVYVKDISRATLFQNLNTAKEIADIEKSYGPRPKIVQVQISELAEVNP